MIAEWYQGCNYSFTPPPHKNVTLVASSVHPTLKEPDLFGRALHVAKGTDFFFGRKVDFTGDMWTCSERRVLLLLLWWGKSRWCRGSVLTACWIILCDFGIPRLKTGPLSPLSCARCLLSYENACKRQHWARGSMRWTIFQLIFTQGILILYPYHFCVWYMYLDLPSFTIKINQMQVNIPYMDPMGYIYI